MAQLAFLAERLSDESGAQRLYGRAAELCGTAEDYKRLAHWVLTGPGDREIARELYAQGAEQLQSPMERLHWAEGIMEVFKDEEWATQAYDTLAPQFAAVNEKQIYQTSRKFRLDRSLRYLAAFGPARTEGAACAARSGRSVTGSHTRES
jgi:hypothetical protein